MGKSVNLFATIAVAMLASFVTLLLLPKGPAHSVLTLPTDFTDSPFVSGLTHPTDIEFAPDGRLFVAEQAGKVYIAKTNGTNVTLVTFLPDLFNIDIVDNVLNGEVIKGCELPDEIVYCSEAQLPSSTGTTAPRSRAPSPQQTQRELSPQPTSRPPSQRIWMPPP